MITKYPESVKCNSCKKELPMTFGRKTRYRNGSKNFYCNTFCRNSKLTSIERFLKKVKINPDTGCHGWIGVLNSWGYGNFNVNKKSILSHRFIWQYHNGHIPEGMIIMHKCDVPACVRIDHLQLGTHADNNADMMAKGRNNPVQQKGTDHGGSKLTEKDVLEIRRLYATGKYSHKELGKIFKICANQSRLIVVRKNWGHI